MRIAIFGRETSKTNYQVLHDFFVYLKEQNISYSILEEYTTQLKTKETFAGDTELLKSTFSTIDEIMQTDFLYCIGGDGTMLKATSFVVPHPIPILGVNVGRLGFLTGASQYELKEITESLKQNAWREDKRTMIEVESDSPDLFANCTCGLNEVTIHKSNTNEMIVVHTFINGEFLNTYWTDGLIISTPTGSTAYNLACGGPIITPHSGVFVITPIAPHSLTVRPIIIPDSAVISFEIESRSGQALIAVDSNTVLVPANAEIAIRKADFHARIVKVPSRTYFSTLRNRLNWGLDRRN